MDINGTCATEFELVKQAFGQNFDEGLELGAAVAVTLDGKPVVDLWAGDADPGGTAWAEDTIVNVFSLLPSRSTMSCALCGSTTGSSVP